MIFYNTNNKGEYTNNEKLAQRFVASGKWESYGQSHEPFVMQSDDSGWVPESEYIYVEPDDEPVSIEDRLAQLEADNEMLNDMILLMLGNVDSEEE